MLSLRTGLVAIALASLCGVVGMAGCSADGGSGVVPDQDQSPTEPPGSSGSLPAPSNPPDDDDDDKTPPKKDAGKDSGKTDAGKDSGPPEPKQGDPCTDATKLYVASCGKCGKWEMRCIIAEGAASGVLSSPGECTGQATGANACMAGETKACGNCGTATCSKTCGWGACMGQPAGACSPGAVEYTTAGCTPGSGAYASKTCSATCAWSGFSATCEVPTTPNKMTVSGTLNGVVSAKWTLASPGKYKRPSGSTCPASSLSSEAPAVAVELRNPTTKTAEVLIYQSKSSTGEANLDLAIWAYSGPSLPLTEEAMKACAVATQDSCTGTLTDNPCGNTAGMDDFAAAEKVTIPPNSKIVVVHAAWLSSADIGDGSFMMNVKTTKLQ